MTRELGKARTIQALVIVGGLLLSLFINYHSYLTDFNLVPGDRGDTRLVVFTLEHWFNVFRGQEAFYSLHMFYPDRLPLAYADGLFLFAIPYAVFRVLGLDYFTSYQILLAFMTALGYGAWVVLLRRALKLETGFAVLGAILLTSLNSLQFQADIGKMTAIHIYPVLLGLLWAFIRTDIKAGWRAMLSLAGFAAGLGLLFFTSYYPAWFFLFTMGVFAVLAFAAGIILEGPRTMMGKIGGFLAARRWQLVTALVVFGVALIPFVATYAPLIRSNANRSFSLVLEFSPTIRDVLNVSEHNYAWSPMLRALGYHFGNREVQMGSPILVTVLFAVVVLAQVTRLRTSGWHSSRPTDRLLVLLSATAIALIALSIRIGDFSLWYPIYRFIPGASALRALGRILMIVDMIFILVTVAGLDEAFRSLKGQKRSGAPYLTAGAAILGAVLVAEQVNGTPFRLDKADQLALMNRYRAPQMHCEAFFINDYEFDDLPFGYYQLDAMMISMNLGIPTVNGYSGFEPHEAFTLVPRGAEYKYRILDWLRLQKATRNICDLDYRSGVFRAVDVDAEFSAAQQDFRAGLLDNFTSLYNAADEFLADGNALSDLYPQYLEEHGYLDPSLGYLTGLRYKWMQGRYWIGERACGKKQCLGIGIVGAYADLQAIIQRYEPRAIQVFFPYPEVLAQGTAPPDETKGQLLIMLPAADFQQ